MTVVKKGYLYKLPRSSMIKHWNKRWVILHSSSREGNLRMEYYDNEAHATREIAKRIIPLEGCHALSQIGAMKSKKYVFDFTTKLGRLVFATDSQEELDDWMKSIKTAVQFDLEVRKRQKMGTTLPDQTSATASARSMEVENVVYESTQTGKYEVEIEPNETSDRLQLEGKYSLVVASDGVKLVKPDSGVEVADWDYKYLKKYGKSTGKFSMETGRASKTGQGKLVYLTTQGHQIFTQIHGNIQYLGSKKKAAQTDSVQQSKSLHNQSATTSQPKTPHEDPASFNPNAEYAVVDKSKKKKKRGSITSHGSPGGTIATTTGIKAGTFRRISNDTPVGSNVYDTPMLQSVSTQQTQQPIAEVQEPVQTSTQLFGKQDSHQDTKRVDGDYDIPMSPSSGAGFSTSPTSMSPSSDMPTSASFASDDLGQFSDDPFSNSGNVVSSPFGNVDRDYEVPPEPEHDYSNAPAFPAAYSASRNGTTTTTAFSFGDDDDDTVFNPLVDVEDFGQYLETGGDDDIWADLINQKFN